MSKGFNSYNSVWVLVLLLIIGGLAGSALGNALAPYVSWLKSTSNIGLKPVTLDLSFITLHFGITAVLNPLTVIGLIIGFIVYRKV